MTTRLPVDVREIDGSIIDRWRRIVECFPQAVAVTTLDSEQFTYAELDLASNRLANALLDALGSENCPVLLLLDHSYDLIVSIMGVIKADKAYVVLDPTQTLGQLKLLGEGSGAPLIVTCDAHMTLARAAATKGELIWSVDALPTGGPHAPSGAISADSFAGIIFTSGTIKRPKGVAYPHRMILHRVWFEDGISCFGPDHRIAGIRPCGLGAGVADLFNALLTGATYCLYPLQAQGLQGLSNWLQTLKITYFHPPVILFRQWLDTLTSDEYFPHLRQILPSGRKTLEDAQRLWPHVAEECMVLTSYGSTEAALLTLRTLTKRTTVADGVLDVGRPLPMKTVMVVQEDGQPARVGEIGEIVVCSRYISPGYWQQPELTAQRFETANDGSGEVCHHTGDFGLLRTDGCLEIIGRQDSQVKVRGYRIVLSEVEDAIQALPAIREAVVTVDEDHDRLLAYVVAAQDPPSPPSGIRSALSASFPNYALPARFIYLNSLPLLASGKINRQALPQPDRLRPELESSFVPPRTTLEEELAAIWARLLGIDQVGARDDFFELGGHSLLTVRLMFEVEEQHGLAVPLSSFFSEPTIARLAETIESTRATAVQMSQRDDEAMTTPDGAPSQPTGDTAFDSVYDVLSKPAGFVRQTRPPFWRQNWGGSSRFIHRCLCSVSPYLSAKLLSWLTGDARLRALCFKDHQTRIIPFLETIDGPADIESAVVSSLYFYLIGRYRLGVPLVKRHPLSRNANPQIRVEGLENLEKARKRGQGVVLVRHHDHGYAWFKTLDLADYRVGSVDYVRERIQRQGHLDENVLHVHQLNGARESLQQGQIVEIHGDLRQGTSRGIEHLFHGRRRAFMTGFAELALMSDAAVFVVDWSLQRPFSARMKLIGPLDNGDHTMTYEDRIEMLVSQYVRLLHRKWAEEPWMLKLFVMDHHLSDLAPS